LILASGLALALGLAAAQYFSPAAAAFARGEDLRISLLSPSRDLVLVWHTGRGVVNAVSFPAAKKRGGLSGYVRARELSGLTGAPDTADREDIFYISFSSSPDMGPFLDILNNWKSRPALFLRAAAFTWRLRREGATNIPPFSLFQLFTEMSRLNSSSFIITDTPRPRPEEVAPPEEADQPARVEVFNASGRRNLAARTAKRLRAAGFDVLTVSSYAKIENNSRVVSYGADTGPAERLRAALGLGGIALVGRPPGRSVAAAAVVLGKDFEERGPVSAPGR